MRELGVSRAGAKELHAIIEIGDYHGGMCFGDGIQFTTGCTFGKGNIEKSGEGKFAVTLIDKKSNRAVRVAYKPTLQPKIKASAFMQSSGRPACRHRRSPTKSRWRWSTSSGTRLSRTIMTVGPIESRTWSEPDEIVRFLVCPKCGELVAEPYARVAEGAVVCSACSGYPR